MLNLNGIKHIHFTGVGGAGMFALAYISIKNGFFVSGSDIQDSSNLESLRAEGASIFVGHDEKNIKNADMVVYSGAVKKTNPEICAAIKSGIQTISRAQFLGMITKQHKNLVAVSGSHGKTTTSTMIACVMIDSDTDPTIIVGAKQTKICGGRAGKSDFAVCEACEFLDSFLELDPAIGVILNIDNDHLDYFGNLENEIKSFGKFAQKCRKIIINNDDENTLKAVCNLNLPKITYGLNRKAEWSARNLKNIHGYFSFDVLRENNKVFSISLKVPGKHNVYNALAAIASCNSLGIKNEAICRSLKNFAGANRRFEKIGEFNGITVVDDFAHHPTEIEATLKAAADMKFRRIWAVFQPHTFSRTFFLKNEFAKVLSAADKVVLTDILPVREINTYGITSQDLGKEIKECYCSGNFEATSDFAAENSRPGDLILTMSGGDNMHECARMIFEKICKKATDFV